MYVLQWPPTFCTILGNSCKTSTKELFYILSLWPADAREASISCTRLAPKTEDQNIKKLVMLLFSNYFIMRHNFIKTSKSLKLLLFMLYALAKFASWSRYRV